MRRLLLSVFALGVVLGVATSARGGMISVEVTADTCLGYLGAFDSSTPYGTRTILSIIGGGPDANAFPLVKFDLQSYSGRTVVGSVATVVLDLIGGNYSQNPAPSVEIHESLVPWDETAITYSSFGGDFGVQSAEIGPVLSTGVIAWDATPRYVTWSIPIALVQSWIDNPSVNNGLLLKWTPAPSWQSLQFASRENLSVAGPRLNINFANAPEPSTLVSLSGAAIALLIYCQRRRRI